jgi:ketosteroid isomerase-like protein
LMAFEGSQEDRLMIRERIGAYSDSVFQNDVEAYLACWTDVCVRVQGRSEWRGKIALREHWTMTWATMNKLAFFTEVGAIEVRGDRAIARSYCREIVVLKRGGIRKVIGVYNDQLLREEGRWLFSRREYQLFMDELSGPNDQHFE